MKKNNTLKNNKGFTLVEIIAVLVLLGILAAVALPRYMDLTEEAGKKVYDGAITELNSRENLAWSKALLSKYGQVTEDDVYPADPVDYYNLGPDFEWTVAVSKAGGTLKFKKGNQKAMALVRTTPPADANGYLQQCPIWSKAP